MYLKRFFLLLITFLLVFAVLPSNIVQATHVDIIDGGLDIRNGTVTIEGPADIDTQDEAMSHVITKYKALITFFSGIATITMIIVFIVQFLKLGTVSNNPMERKQAITGLLVSGVSVALFGSVTLFVGVFYGLLK